MPTTQCSECDESIEIPGRARLGQTLTCGNCGARLEVVATDPLELDLAGDDDVWDEEEEDEDLEIEDEDLDEELDGKVVADPARITPGLVGGLDIEDELADELDEFEEDDDEIEDDELDDELDDEELDDELDDFDDDDFDDDDFDFDDDDDDDEGYDDDRWS
jgi:lysine biosynthesis protein LysW